MPTPTACCICVRAASSAHTTRAAPARHISRRLSMLEIRQRLGTEHWLAVVIVIRAPFLSLMTHWFQTLPHSVDILETYSVTTILALGVFVVLVAGGIDISFAATASVAQYAAAYAAAEAGWPAVLAIPLGLAIGTG